MTGVQVADAGIACQCWTMPLKHVPCTLTNHDTRGLVELIAERGTGRMLGVHVLADGTGNIVTDAS